MCHLLPLAEALVSFPLPSLSVVYNQVLAIFSEIRFLTDLKPAFWGTQTGQ